jgi:general secretion pathway protein H
MPTLANKLSKPRGFSIFEMVIVVAIISSLTALASTSFAPAAGRARLKAEASTIAAILASARTRAITERLDMSVVIDTRQQSIVSGTPTTIREVPQTLTLSIARPSSSEGGEWPQLTIVFQPEGGASGGDFALSDGTQAVTFHVDWLTGRVTTTTERANAS